MLQVLADAAADPVQFWTRSETLETDLEDTLAEMQADLTNALGGKPRAGGERMARRGLSATLPGGATAHEAPVEGYIPRIIVQTHRHPTFADVPEANRLVMQRLRDDNPKWDYRYYNDAQQELFVSENMPTHVLLAYNSLSSAYGPAKADLFRYVVIYVNGGVYLDCKSIVNPLGTATASLDALLSGHRQAPFVGHWDTTYHPHAQELKISGGELINWLIAAPARHPMMRHVVDTVVANIESQLQLAPQKRERWKKGVLRVTGPLAYTRAVYEYKDAHSELLIHRSVFEIGCRYSVDLRNGTSLRSAMRQPLTWHTADKQETWHYTHQSGPVVVPFYR